MFQKYDALIFATNMQLAVVYLFEALCLNSLLPFLVMWPKILIVHSVDAPFLGRHNVGGAVSQTTNC